MQDAQQEHLKPTLPLGWEPRTGILHVSGPVLRAETSDPDPYQTEELENNCSVPPIMPVKGTTPTGLRPLMQGVNGIVVASYPQRRHGRFGIP